MTSAEFTADDGADVQFDSISVAPPEAAIEPGSTLTTAYDNTGGTLTVGKGTDTGALILGSGGTIEGGTVIDTGGGLIAGGGTLDGVAYVGTLVAGGQLTIAGTTTFAGIGGGQGAFDIPAGGVVAFQNGGTLDNVAIQLGGTIGGAGDPPGTLTLGAAASLAAIAGDSGLVGIPLVNGGTIDATAGGVLTIDSLQNNGSVAVSDGGVLYLGETTNNGQITEANATLNLEAPDLALLDSLDRTGGIVGLGGTLALDGGTLSVGAGTALGQLQANGLISGGTIHDSGGGLVFFGPRGPIAGTLAADTYQGTVNLIPPGSSLVVAGGVTFADASGKGAGTINLLGAGSDLDFVGSQTLDNVTVNVGGLFSATTLAASNPTDAPVVLTLGPHANITQWGPRAVIAIDRGLGDALVNQGVLGAVAKNGEMLIQGRTFANQGKLVVANGEELSLQVNTLGNLSGGTLSGGQWQVNDGSTLDLGYDNPIATLNAALYLGGPGAVVQSLDSATGLETTLNQSLQTIGDGGELVLANGASFDQTGVLRDFGRVVLAGGTLAAQPLAIFPNADVIGFGTLAGTIYNSGIVMAQGGNLALNGAFYPGGQTGAAWINVGATLTASSALAVPVRFISSTGELVLEQANATVGTISGFTGSDLIDLRNVSPTGVSLNFSNGVLTVKTGTTTDAALHFAGNYVTQNFSATSDGHGGTLIKDPPLSFTSATLTPADLGGAGGTGTGGGGTVRGLGGTIAVPSVVGMAVGSNDSTHGGAVAMLTVGH